MGNLKKTIKRIRAMSTPTYIFLKINIIISILYLAVSLFVFVYAGEMTIENLHLFKAAKELYTIPQGVLLIASIGSVCIEDMVI